MTHRRPSRLPTRRGQSTVEYMLVIAVLVIAMVTAAYTFVGPFSQGYSAMTQDAGVVLSSGTRNGSGNRR
jgi:Flp pilus assembly pilin Flp